jgi:hypothetical protein
MRRLSRFGFHRPGWTPYGPDADSAEPQQTGVISAHIILPLQPYSLSNTSKK